MRPNSFRPSGVNDADGLSVYKQTNPARWGQPVSVDSCQCCSCSLSSQQCPHVLACLCTGPVSLWGWSHGQQAIRLHLALPSCPLCDVRHLRGLHGCAPPGQTLTLLMLLFQWACAQANALRHVQGSTCHGKGAMVVASLAGAMRWSRFGNFRGRASFDETVGTKLESTLSAKTFSLLFAHLFLTQNSADILPRTSWFFSGKLCQSILPKSYEVISSNFVQKPCSNSFPSKHQPCAIAHTVLESQPQLFTGEGAPPKAALRLPRTGQGLGTCDWPPTYKIRKQCQRDIVIAPS